MSTPAPALPACFAPSDDRPETVVHAALIAARGSEAVFIARDPEAAAALREWGLVAAARPIGGRWTVEALRPMLGRDVVILNGDALAETSWAERDVEAVRDAARSVGVHLPSEIADGKCESIPAYVAMMRRLALGPQALAVEALAALTPTMPAVEIPDDAPGWPPLRLGALPDAPTFPLDTLPPSVAEFAAEAAAAVGCDPAFVAGPALAVAAGLIGRSCSLQLGSNWFASSSMFMCVVGNPGDGKSPALEYAAEPAGRIEAELGAAFEVARQEYEATLRQSRKRKGGAPDEPEPIPPTPRRVRVDDSTSEALFRVLSANGRGVLMVRDELSALIHGMNQYKGGSGNDRPNLLKAWSCKSVLIDRIRNDYGAPTRIPHPSLAIVGCGTPALLAGMMGRGEDDGFIDRWLYVWPARRPKPRTSQRRPLSDAAASAWEETCRRLWARGMARGDDGREHPHVIYPRNEAKAEFDRLCDAHCDEINSPAFDDELRGPWSKLEEMAMRLWLALTLLAHAADPTSAADELPRAGIAEARAAWRLVDYFKATHRRVQAYLHGRGRGGPRGVRWLLRWLENHGDVAAFAESDLTRDVPHFRQDRACLADALAYLADRGAIRRVPEPDRPRGTRGRKASPVWEVHPMLGASGNSHNPES